MSLILDALKRAERERKAQAAPMLADLAQSPGAPVPARRYWRYGGIAVLALIAGLLLWTGLKDRPRPAPQADVVSELAPAPPATPATVIPGTESVASLDDLTDETVTMAEAGSETPPTAPAPAAPAPGQAPAAVSEPAAPDPQTPVQAAPPTGTSSGAVRSEPPVNSGIPPALTQPAPLRKLREMPPDYRADFPALSVEVHVYERAVAKRMLMVNGRRYREGERLAEGPLVVEILPEGIVFEHRGEKVLYTLGR